MPFSHLPPLLAEALIARGYEALTPVQAEVSKPDSAGRDLLVSAQTGSGKTVAFGLAMAEELLKSPKEQAENLMIVDLIRHDLSGVKG